MKKDFPFFMNRLMKRAIQQTILVLQQMKNMVAHFNEATDKVMDFSSHSEEDNKQGAVLKRNAKAVNGFLSLQANSELRKLWKAEDDS